MRIDRTLAWLLLAGLSAAVAGAQTDEQRKTARDLMDQGDERAEQKDFAAALTLYRAAHDIMHVPTTGIEVARTLASLGKLVEARDAALEVLKLPEAPNEPKPFTIARVAADQLVRDLTRRIPTLRVMVGPPEAEKAASLRIDGVLAPQALSHGYPLNPDTHRVEVSSPGFNPLELRVALADGDRESMRVVMQPSPSLAPSPAPARAPSPTPAVPQPGSAPERAWYSTSWPTWVGLGVVGAGIATGTVAGLIAIDRVDAARAYCTGNSCTPEAREDREAALSAATVSNIGWAVAGAGAAFTIASYWLSRPKSVSSSGLSVAAAQGGGMLEWRGSL